MDVMEYETRSGRYRIRLGKGDTKQHEAFLNEILTTAYDQSRTGTTGGGV
jgi:hypothetical protein